VLLGSAYGLSLVFVLVSQDFLLAVGALMVHVLFPAIKIGNRNYFDVEKLEEWIKSRTVQIAS